MRKLRVLLVALLPAVVFLGLASPPAGAEPDDDDKASANVAHLFSSPNRTGAINSDMAFWGDKAYVGNYDSFRIFDISNPRAPEQLVDFQCTGPQNDPVVWKNKLLFLAVDRTLTGPGCNANPTLAHDDPNGWEGVRIFDVTNARKPRLVKSVYTDCGAHTITLYPKDERNVMLYVSSYPLLPGPTCGPERGPEAGNSPLHEKLSVINVPVDEPTAARVVAEPKVSYPGDWDNRFVPAEHNLPGFNPLTGCHDIAVFAELKLAAGACAEQAQMWRIKANGVPDTENPLWVFDDRYDRNGATGDPADQEVAVDFWHSATFSWDGKVVNFIDESFGTGCPPITPIGRTTKRDSDTGRMFFLNTRTGEKYSHYALPRKESALNAEGNETAYCSAHLGNAVRATDRRLLVNAWYMGGFNVVDFTNPRNPREVAYYDRAPAGPTGSDVWSAYWYQSPTSGLSGDALEIYANDGIFSPTTGQGFQVFRARVEADEKPVWRMNPQTQERVIPLRR